MEPINLEELTKVDDRGRILLGKEFAGKYFRKEVDGEFKIVLVSYTVLPEREVWLHRNPVAMASLDEGIRQLERGEGVRGHDFLQYADDDSDENSGENEDEDRCPTN